MQIYTGKEEIKGKKILLYFYANYMPFHKRMMKVIENLKEEDYTVFIIDIGEFKDMAKGYGVTSIPTFLFIKNKKVQEKIEGLQMSSVINNAVYRIFLKGKNNEQQKN